MLVNIRIIPKLEVKGPNLIKGIHLEGLRIVGKPEVCALKYYQNGADEIIYIDLVASLYRRKYLLDIINKTANQVFIPLTIGGGINTIKDMLILFKAGADKIAINTGAIKNPELISQAARKFGSQCIVVSIEIQEKNNFWEAYTDCGRTPSGLNAITWAKRAVKLGAGELLITSINQDGTYKGFDLDLIKSISQAVKVPVIASGGAGKLDDFLKVIKIGKADAVCASSVFHYHKFSFIQIKKYLKKHQLDIRI